MPMMDLAQRNKRLNECSEKQRLNEVLTTTVSIINVFKCP
jgi:hypothetical protein